MGKPSRKKRNLKSMKALQLPDTNCIWSLTPETCLEAYQTIRYVEGKKIKKLIEKVCHNVDSR
jgi:hypothetical protein